jgi:hypothetical protein
MSELGSFATRVFCNSGLLHKAAREGEGGGGGIAPFQMVCAIAHGPGGCIVFLKGVRYCAHLFYFVYNTQASIQ